MKSREELISVIVPIYNVEDYLENTINSLINQTYEHIEIILVDDGSLDRCPIICDCYMEKDLRIRVIHKENGGLSDARNVGIKNASGKYITFIDSDDIIETDYIEYLYNLIIKYDTEISICSHNIVNGKKIINEGKNYIEEKLDRVEALKRLLLNRGYSVSACGKLYKKDLFKDICFPKGKLCEDNGTIYKLIDKSDFIAYGNIPKYNYMIRNNSITTSKFNLRKMDLIELTDEMCGYVRNKYPELDECSSKREIESRFAILRQMVFSEYYKSLEIDEIIDYIKKRSKLIFTNEYSTLRDKIALLTLLIGKNMFKFSWRVYLKLK